MQASILEYFQLVQHRSPRRHSHRLAIALAASATAIVGAVTLAVAATFFLYQSTTAAYPPLDQQLSVRGTGITTVYDRHGEPLGVLTNPNSAIGEPVLLGQISSDMIEATISTEDNSFWSHAGFDVGGIARAAWHNYATGSSSTGGSTITQQLVKTAYFTTDCELVDGLEQCSAPRTVSRKVKEVMLAMEAEGRYPKEQILTWYLNSISYSGRYVGVEAAAQGYFEKAASELTLPEAATLAGLPSAPTRYDPRRNCQVNEAGQCIRDERGRLLLGGDSKARQEYVIDLMVRHGRITEDEAESAKAAPVFVSPGLIENNAASFIDSQVEPRLVRLCQAGLLPQIEGTRDCIESVHTAGYKVTTTLDWSMNLEASAMLNRFLNAGLAAGCDCHNAAIVTIEPASGEVVVYVPSLDPTWVSDSRVAGNIDQLAELHQPGSSFKPAVYLAWLDGLNKTPMSTIWDTNPLKLIDKPAKPEDQVTITNPGRNPAGEGLITARAALGGSQNVPAFRAATEAGVENVIAMAKKLGITTLDQNFDPTFYNHDSVIYGAAIATGGANIRAIDMAYMNATISNMGVMNGVPTYADTLELKDVLSIGAAEGDALERALKQRDAFLQGYVRLLGTRELDPVVVLRVETAGGQVVYDSQVDWQQRTVVDPGSVWMLHTIMSDCTARFLIWQCGSSNDDLSLDFFVQGTKIPGGVKTGTQQGATSAEETLETWMTGYSRYAATAVWVGNADKTPVKDGPAAGYASANTTVRLFKNWMGAYHARLQSLGVFATPAGFEELQPGNVKLAPFPSATTERGRAGGCGSRVTGWQRTDIDYQNGDCTARFCVPLPEFKPDLARALAVSRRIPACGVSLPAQESTPTATSTEPANNGQPRPGTPGPNQPIATPNPGGQGAPPRNQPSSPSNQPTTRPKPGNGPNQTPPNDDGED